MSDALRRHWPEYLMEAAGLGAFMISACLFASLLEHPASSLRQGLGDDTLRRVLMGLAMGLTAVAIIYSPWGKRSGAHLNPAVTLTYWRLGKVEGWDAAFYVLAQFAGGAAGVLAARALIGPPVAHPAVHYVVTAPGAGGPLVAFVAEVVITFVLMSVVLVVSNSRWAPVTGLCAGLLVAGYISLEAPLSGMSMNPARTWASAVAAQHWAALWVYFTAPLLGMFLAADAYLWLAGPRGVLCAKLNHLPGARCIFRCGYARAAERQPAAAGDGRRAVAALVGLGSLLVLVLAGRVVLAQPAAARVEVRAVDAVAMTVADMDRSVDFYSRVLSFEKVSDVEVAGGEHERLMGVFGLRMRVVRMRLGAESIELVEFLAPRGRPVPQDSRSNDHWFQHIAIIVNDMDQAYEWLRRHKVAHASPGPQRLPDWNRSAGGIRAFYFRDPDGHPLEILQFPPGKGDPRWHGPSDRVFLGIDHTAIVVGDTEASLRLYRDLLGLRVAGESENHGPEQERLNNVFGARLRITTLRAPAGPGIELLEYLAPRDGRPGPPDARANDLAFWRTVLVTGDAAPAARRPAAGLLALVSPGRVLLPDAALGFRAGLLARDPDGHAIQLVER
jgi:MIP family channel proteins